MSGPAALPAKQPGQSDRWSGGGLDALVERLRGGEAAALARALSIMDAGGEPARRLLRAVRRFDRAAAVVGFTGPPGAGKSTLISAYIGELRAAGKTVAALAVDPSSPLSGGAILGDRARMGDHSADPGVFIRSLAARGHLGGLTTNIHALLDVVHAAGRDVIVIETVGTGQSEIEIVRVADATIVINAPGLGDDVQAMKAGILEIADILAVNKSDLPGAANTEQQLAAMLQLRAEGSPDVPVIRTVATSGEGLGDLAAAVDAICARITPADRAGRVRDDVAEQIADAAARQVRRSFLQEGGQSIETIADQVVDGTLDAEEAARRWLAAEGFAAPGGNGTDDGRD